MKRRTMPRRLSWEDEQAGGEASPEHEQLPGSHLLHLHLLLPLAIILQYLPVAHFLRRKANIQLPPCARKNIQ